MRSSTAGSGPRLSSSTGGAARGPQRPLTIAARRKSSRAGAPCLEYACGPPAPRYPPGRPPALRSRPGGRREGPPGKEDYAPHNAPRQMPLTSGTGASLFRRLSQDTRPLLSSDYFPDDARPRRRGGIYSNGTLSLGLPLTMTQNPDGTGARASLAQALWVKAHKDYEFHAASESAAAAAEGCSAAQGRGGVPADQDLKEVLQPALEVPQPPVPWSGGHSLAWREPESGQKAFWSHFLTWGHSSDSQLPPTCTH